LVRSPTFTKRLPSPTTKGSRPDNNMGGGEPAEARWFTVAEDAAEKVMGLT
jgi:hypothetical protein